MWCYLTIYFVTLICIKTEFKIEITCQNLRLKQNCYDQFCVIFGKYSKKEKIQEVCHIKRLIIMVILDFSYLFYSMISVVIHRKFQIFSNVVNNSKNYIILTTICLTLKIVDLLEYFLMVILGKCQIIITHYIID